MTTAVDDGRSARGLVVGSRDRAWVCPSGPGRSARVSYSRSGPGKRRGRAPLPCRDAHVLGAERGQRWSIFRSHAASSADRGLEWAARGLEPVAAFKIVPERRFQRACPQRSALGRSCDYPRCKVAVRRLSVRIWRYVSSGGPAQGRGSPAEAAPRSPVDVRVANRTALERPLGLRADTRSYGLPVRELEVWWR